MGHRDRRHAAVAGVIAALVRHPRPLVAPGVCYGRLDLELHPLADLAAIQAALGDFRPAVLWTSPARRCRAVAERLGTAWSLAPRVDERLLELDFGDWEGRPWDDVPRAELDRWAADPAGFAAPGGETGAALLARVAGFHGVLEADCAVVSHGGPLKLLAALLRGEPADLLAPAPPIGSVRFVETPR